MAKTKRFQRTVEDFKCLNCGCTVVGSGYTNHCPQCLWSRHVDNSPGDRACECHGMMEPVGALLRGGERLLVHRCQSCAVTRRINLVPGDSEDKFLEVMVESNGVRI